MAAAVVVGLLAEILTALSGPLVVAGVGAELVSNLVDFSVLGLSVIEKCGKALYCARAPPPPAKGSWACLPAWRPRLNNTIERDLMSLWNLKEGKKLRGMFKHSIIQGSAFDGVKALPRRSNWRETFLAFPWLVQGQAGKPMRFHRSRTTLVAKPLARG